MTDDLIFAVFVFVELAAALADIVGDVAVFGFCRLLGFNIDQIVILII